MLKTFSRPLLVTLTFLAMSSAASSHEYKAGDLTIQHPWSRATPGGAKVGGGYLTVVNNGASADRLVGGSAQIAKSFEIHDMAVENGIMKMRPAGPIDIPAGGTLTLAPGGKHIMMIGLSESLKEGDRITGTLVFEKAGTVDVEFKVEALGASAPAAGAGARPAEGGAHQHH
jgi:periplasmic copper chaperone A